MGRFKKGRYMLMHSLIYRTEILKRCSFRLPEHTFYVDNLYVFIPFTDVKSMYYLNVNLYRYYIGRNDQSVNEKVMIKRIDQQLRVNKLMIDKADFTNVPPKMRRYMLNYLEIVTLVSSVLLIRGGTAEHLRKKAALWEYMKEKRPEVYKKLRYTVLGGLVNTHTKAGRIFVLFWYELFRVLIGFN
ncbi:hypothetical protein [Anaerocolumna sp.]|uniref:hypothetical protein n=1 Tax=Anaerocolumna sp. TaxID=2041569 RepID=UPI0028A691EA|nr:hypothetical protein [Anaerocolumna sp.]